LAFDCILYGAGGLVSLPANLLQGGTCAAIGVVLGVLLSRITPIKKQFPDFAK
jgi:hypothetical protein